MYNIHKHMLSVTANFTLTVDISIPQAGCNIGLRLLRSLLTHQDSHASNSGDSTQKYTWETGKILDG